MSERAARAGLIGLPVNLLVRERPVVVVGAGGVATRKIESLLEAGARVTVIAPEVSDEVRFLSVSKRITLHERRFTASDLDGAWLAFTATDDSSVNASVADAAEARRIWVNSADDPENCSFTLMSVIRRGDLVVTIGTGGRSPALAAHLRRTWEAELGPEYDDLLDILSEAREGLRAAGRSTEDANWQRAFDQGIVDLVRAGRIDDAKEMLKTCL